MTDPTPDGSARAGFRVALATLFGCCVAVACLLGATALLAFVVDGAFGLLGLHSRDPYGIMVVFAAAALAGVVVAAVAHGLRRHPDPLRRRAALAAFWTSTFVALLGGFQTAMFLMAGA